MTGKKDEWLRWMASFSPSCWDHEPHSRKQSCFPPARCMQVPTVREIRIPACFSAGAIAGDKRTHRRLPHGAAPFCTSVFALGQLSCVQRLHLQDTSSRLQSVGETKHRHKGLGRWLLRVFDVCCPASDTSVIGDRASLSSRWSPSRDGVTDCTLRAPCNNWLDLTPRPPKRRLCRLILQTEAC